MTEPLDQIDSRNINDNFRLSPVRGCLTGAVILVVFYSCLIGMGKLLEFFHQTDVLARPGFSVLEFTFALVFSYAVWRLLKIKKPINIIGLNWDRLAFPHLLIGTVFGLGGVALAFLIMSVAAEVRIVEGIYRGAGSSIVGPLSPLVAAFMFMVYAGSEEIFSRGLLFPLLKGSVGLAGGIFFSSIAFSILHFFNPAFSILPAIDIFLAGVLLCLCKELTGNLWLAWGTHFGWNFALILAGIPVSGYLVIVKLLNFHIETHGPAWITGGGFGPEGGIGAIVADSAMILIVLILISVKRRKQVIQ
ncbi:MAG: type II CAAX endopeptidase family protein [bacterium]